MVSVRLSVDLWMHWSDMAIANEGIARRARHRLVDGGSDVTHELRASLAGITASAACLDALFGQVITEVPRPAGTAAKVCPVCEQRLRRPTRAATVLEALRLRFSVDKKLVADWKSRVGWLFNLRDQAVHPRWSMLDPVPHPS